MVNPLLLIVPLVFSVATGHLEVVHEWKYIDYVWTSPAQKQDAIDSGKYNFTQIVTIDVDRAGDGRIFVTTPRLQTGVPATLSTISNKFGKGGPLLRPYPNWRWNTIGDCRSITSVFRVVIDNCNKLWVLDTGKNGEEQICPAQLLVFDLRTDKLVKRIQIPANYSQNENSKGLLITPVIETHGITCDYVTVYMADTEGYGLVVYNGRGLRRFSDQSFNFDPNHSNFTIAGESFHLEDGLFSLALQPKTHDSDSSRLFYRPLATLKQHFVSTRNFGGNLENSMTPIFKTIDYTFPSQVSIQAFSRNGVLFMGYTNPPSIACWNSHKPMNNDNVVIIAQNDKTLQFTSGLKIKGNHMWATTNRFQKIMTGTQNFSECNFRVLFEPNINNLIQGTNCQ